MSRPIAIRFFFLNKRIVFYLSNLNCIKSCYPNLKCLVNIIYANLSVLRSNPEAIRV